MRFFSTIVALFIISVGFVFLLGYLEPEEYSGEVKEFFPERRHIIWEGLVDVSRIPRVKNDVESVIILSNNRGLVTWKENLRRGGYRSYKTVEKREPYRYTVQLFESSSGLKGTWTYALKSSDNGTIVQIIEESTLQNTWLRGIGRIRGRDTHLLQSLKEIRVLLFRNLLDTP